MKLRSILHGAAAVSVALALAMTLGCGPTGPPRYDVHGSVTFDGQPVPAGTILFVPVPPNTGPGGSASIADGRYDTAENGGVSPTGGKHRLTLQGFDGQAEGEMPLGQPTFGPYDVELDLPQERSEQNLDVPASARVKPPTVTRGPA